MHQVSLRNKIAQMLLVGFDGQQVIENSPIIEQLDKHGLGGVILFDYHLPQKKFDKNIGNPEQVRLLNEKLQQFNQALNTKHHRPPLPLLIAVDYEGGAVNRLKAQYGFPETIAAQDLLLMSEPAVQQVALQMAQTLKETGFNLNFAPVLDLNINPDNPVLGKLGRCFSEKSSEVIRLGRLFAQAFRAEGIHPVYKHFPGHGSSKADSHLGFVDVTDMWQPDELEPYRTLLTESDCQMIMTAHVVNRHLDDTGIPATLSYKVLTKLLRETMGYTGLIITDDMQMKSITDQYGLEESMCLAINAGADMFIFGNQLVATPQDPGELIDLIEKNVMTGIIKPERIEEAFVRIVAFKQQLSRVQ